jgi:hypothetical protein
LPRDSLSFKQTTVTVFPYRDFMSIGSIQRNGPLL